MAVNVWCNYHGWQDSLFPDSYDKLGYFALSPTLSKKVWFGDKKDIDAEIDRILGIKDDKFSFGQTLYHYIPFFCNALLFADTKYTMLIEEYMTCIDYKILLARSLDETPVFKSRFFGIIRQELIHCQKLKMDQNG